MIDIFDMKNDLTFFTELALSKHQEDKVREVVFIISLFPKILEDMEAKNTKSTMPMRRQLMAQLIEQNDITTAKLLVSEDKELGSSDKIFLVHKQFFKYRNAKKSAQLIKEFKLDLSVIQQEFEEIENIIVGDAMNFYMKQFGVSFKHYSMDNVLRLAEYLTDFNLQNYGKPLAFLIEKLVHHELFDEAKHLTDLNANLVRRHLKEESLKRIDKH